MLCMLVGRPGREQLAAVKKRRVSISTLTWTVVFTLRRVCRLGQAGDCKNGINAALNIDAARKGPGFRLGANHRACQKQVRPISQIAVDHFSTRTIYIWSVQIAETPQASRAGLIHYLLRMYCTCRLVMPGQLYMWQGGHSAAPHSAIPCFQHKSCSESGKERLRSSLKVAAHPTSDAPLGCVFIRCSVLSLAKPLFHINAAR